MPADGKRKVRCPKCTAVLTEPQHEIYQCPICSALLLAKGASGVSNLRTHDNEYPQEGRDVDGTQGKLESENVNPDIKLGTTIKLPMEGNASGQPNRQEYTPPLPPNSSPKKGLIPRISALFSRAPDREMPRNGGSSFKSEEGDRFSELSSASYTESDYEGDSPLRASEDRLEYKDGNVHTLRPNPTSPAGPANGYVQKERSLNEVDVPYYDESSIIGVRNRTNLDSTSSSDVYGVSVSAQDLHLYDNGSHNRSAEVHHKEVSSKREESNENKRGSTDDCDISIPKSPGRRLFDLSVFGILDENAFNAIKRGKHASTVKMNEIGEPQKNSPNTKDSVIEMKQVNWIQKPDVINAQDHVEQNDNLPKFHEQDIGASKEIAVAQQQNLENRNITANLKNRYTDSVPSVVGLNTEVLSDVDADALVAARYGNALSEKDLSPDVPVDVSFGDWKSPHDVPEQRDNKGSETRMINVKEEESDEWDEDDHADGEKKDTRNIKTMEESQSFQGSSSLTIREDTSPDRSTVPLRTAAMRKFLVQRVDQENKTKRHVQDEEINIYEAPYEFNDTLQQNISKEESHGEKVTINMLPVDKSPSDYHYEVPDAVTSSTTQPLNFTEIGMESSTIKSVNSKESDSEGSKYAYAPIDRTDRVGIEVAKKLTDLSLHPLPPQATRRSTLQWKGKSAVTKLELRSNAENMQIHGINPIPSRDMGKDGHGPSVTVVRSQFDENGKHGSGLLSMRQNEAWNMTFNRDNDPFQQSNMIRTDSTFSYSNSLRSLGDHKRTQINRVPVYSGENTDYNNKWLIQSQESQFRGQPREEYLGELYNLSNQMLHPLPLPSHSPTSPNRIAVHHCHSPSCTFCIQPQHDRQQPHMLQNTVIHQCATCISQPSARSYQPVHDDLSPTVEVLSNSSNSYKGRSPPPKSQRRNRSKMHNQFLAAVERDKRFYPPLPDRSSAPYVFCNGCNQILEVPSYLPPNRGPIQKLKCGTCRKVSKFSIYSQGSNNSSLVDEGSAVHAYQHESELFMDSVSERSFERISVERGRREQLGSSFLTRKNGSLPQFQEYFQGKPNASSFADYDSYPGTVGMLGQGRFGLGNSNIKAYSEGYNSSTPSSASGSSPRKQQMNLEKAAFEEDIQSEGLDSETKMYEENERYTEAVLSDEFSHRNSDMGRNKIAHASSQGHHVKVQRQRAASWQNQDAEVVFSRNSSRNDHPQSKGMSSGPINSFQDSQSVNPNLYQERLQKDPSGDLSTAPWSPTAESPLSSQKAKDSETESRPLSPQSEMKGPKYYAELITKGLRDIGKGYRTGNRGKVIVNGHLIHDAAVRKAEEKAGTIHPGSYWYDYSAGFWGLMGGPCQGIVMSHIKEFNFPMEKSCAGGKTGIFVNGRELHEKDLDILAKRGLPKVPGMAYVVDMQGNVKDEATGEQLKGLGKLAPSIEKKGCGWGMFQSGGKH